VQSEAGKQLTSGEGSSSNYLLVEQVVDQGVAEQMYAEYRPKSFSASLLKVISASEGLAKFDTFTDADILNQGILPHLSEAFYAILELDVLDAARKYGKDSAVEMRLKSVIERCAPFASLDDTAMGDMGRAVKQLFIGVSDRDDQRYQDLLSALGVQAQLVSTGDRNQILVVACETGLPAFAFNAIPNYQYHYEVMSQRIMTEGLSEFLHVNKDWADPKRLPSVFPDQTDGAGK
jgi:hypothetical protein